MARIARDTDFTVDVEDVGRFTFGRRSMRDEVALQVEYAKLIDGAEPTEWLATVCGWLAAFKVLIVRAPEGWDIEEMDPLDQSTYAKMSRVYSALRLKEQSFRRSPSGGSESNGAGPV